MAPNLPKKSSRSRSSTIRLVADALAQIRDRSTPNALFRQNLERIGTLLLARATETLPTHRHARSKHH